MQPNRHITQVHACSRLTISSHLCIYTGITFWLLLAWVDSSQLIATSLPAISWLFFLHKSVPAPKGGTPSQNKGGWGYTQKSAILAHWPNSY